MVRGRVKEREQNRASEHNLKSVFSHANFPAGVPGRETKADEKPSLNAVRTQTKDELMRGTLALTIEKQEGSRRHLLKIKRSLYSVKGCHWFLPVL